MSPKTSVPRYKSQHSLRNSVSKIRPFAWCQIHIGFGCFHSLGLYFLSPLDSGISMNTLWVQEKPRRGLWPSSFPPIPQPFQGCQPNSHIHAGCNLTCSGCTPQLVPAFIPPKGAAAHTDKSCGAPCLPVSPFSTQSYASLRNSDHIPQTLQGISNALRKFLKVLSKASELLLLPCHTADLTGSGLLALSLKCSSPAFTELTVT